MENNNKPLTQGDMAGQQKKFGPGPIIVIAIVVAVAVVIGVFYFSSEEPIEPRCNSYVVDECPAECVVCPPCNICSNITCQAEEFCADLGIDRTWYEDILSKINTEEQQFSYANGEYGFEFKYLSVQKWKIRNGIEDYKPEGMLNFYQFCDAIISEPSDTPVLGDNFIGRCGEQLFRVEIWEPDTEIEALTSDFSTLNFDGQMQVLIDGVESNRYFYSGPHMVLDGLHNWRVFIVPTDDYTLVLSGNICMDEKPGWQCEDIVSSFEFMDGINEEAHGYIKDAYARDDIEYLDIDYIQWLTGDACKEKQIDNPNGYCIVNENPKIRTFKIADDVEIRMQTYSHARDGNFNYGEPITYAEFKEIYDGAPGSRLRNVPYMIEVVDSIVVKITEQYIP